jgi:hypothetical protein
MAKGDNRRTIRVEEAVFEVFDERRKVLGLNSSDTLQTLLQKEVTRTETTVVSDKILKRCGD